MEKSRSAARGRKVPQVAVLSGSDADESAAEDAAAIGQRIREARQSLKLSQADLAAQLGASKPGLQQNEAGKNMPGARLLLGFCRLGISADWILTGRGSMRYSDTLGTGAAKADMALLEEVVTWVAQTLADRNLAVTPRKQAELVAVLYEYVADTGGQVEAEKVERILRLVA